MRVKVADLEFETLIDNHTIEQRIKLLSEQIESDYDGLSPIFLGVLNGCFLFMADLIKNISIPCEVTFTKLASYYGGTTTTRNIRSDIELHLDIRDRHVVIVEDIIDSGNTLSFLINKLKLHNPASIQVCALLSKPDAAEVEIPEVTYIGFEIDNEFVVGYGLDYKELGRNLKDIYRLVSSTTAV
jgi:hypoxanthine phosphoribosyltransferase